MAPKKKSLNLATCTCGRARSYLQDNYSLTDDSIACLNGHILLLYYQNGYSVIATTKVVSERFGYHSAYERVNNLVRKTKGMLKSYTSSDNRQRFEKICQTPFGFGPACKPVPEQESTVQVTYSMKHKSPCKEAVPEAVVLTPQLEGAKFCVVSDPGPSALSPPSTCAPSQSSTFVLSAPPALTLRTKDSTAREQLLRKRLLFQSKSTATMKKYYREQIAKLKVKLKTHPTIIKYLREKVRRLQVQIKILKHKLRMVSKSGSELEKTRYKKMRQACKQKCKDKMKKMRTDYKDLMRDQELEFDRRLREKEQQFKSILAEKDKLIQQLMAE